ncbi:sensor histidine kinase [Amycolatopsis thermophila]|uniref:Signal transduction histidine kinase n=1 Tax=Amycolatopsis thermophila TaxID=206084 RepID=A0ABU0EYF7_9PSEU|nr:ATP-binding protein [Amycolatopsis thermophila]MDQ0379900.1 signal transduction histidine kinase [Amycolatopsis thermophila]
MAANFLLTLLSKGAGVLASTPPELPDEIDDPEPVSALRRIGAVAASSTDGPRSSLMVRATRYAVLLPLVYRIGTLPIAWVWLVAAYGPLPAATIVAWVGVVANLAGLVWVLRVPDRDGRTTRLVLGADLVFALAGGVLVSAVAPASLYWAAAWIPFLNWTGTVGLWTMCRGVPAGVTLVVLGVPVQLGLLALGGQLPMWVPALIGGTGTALVAVVVAAGTLVLLGVATRLALAIGMRLGVSGERARTERALHDTVLQALEAMAMRGPGDADDPAGALARVRAQARAQAGEVRRGIGAPGGQGEGLAAELTGLATEMAREGLRAKLALTDLAGDTLTEARRAAVRDAAREALRNTLKHAGTREVVIRLAEHDGGIAVVIRDHGVGYDEDQRPAGFGVSSSMKARLTEAGGWCRIDSKPGHGTRVTLWVPR